MYVLPSGVWASKPRSTRGQAPELLGYAASSWFSHLCSSSPNFGGSQYAHQVFSRVHMFLTWIHILAKNRSIYGSWFSASVYLHSFALKRQKIDSNTMPLKRQIAEREIVESWAVDLVKIVGKFGSNLIKSPDSIYKAIPPFCPHDSITYQQFRSERNPENLAVSGFSSTGWDDLLARLSFGAETVRIEDFSCR